MVMESHFRGPNILQPVIDGRLENLKLFVLDTTDPDTILSVEQQVDLNTTLFIVASKSGKTPGPQQDHLRPLSWLSTLSLSQASHTPSAS